MGERSFQFEWDESKAEANERKHGVTFESASTIFFDPNLLTIADVEHTESEERWFSVGVAGSGSVLSLVYLWSTEDPTVTQVRLISARKATTRETEQYWEGI